MSTISETSSTSSSSGPNQTQLAKVANDLKTLAAALKKGDTKAAEAAMLQLQIDSASVSSASSGSSSASGPAVADLSKVASALKSGDLFGAQSAFSTFESNAAAAYKKSHPSSAADASGTDASVEAQVLTGLSDDSTPGSTFSVVV